MSIVSLIVEGAQSAILPCSAVLFVPTFGAVLAARSRHLAVAAVAIGAGALGAFVRFADIINLFPGWLIGLCLLAGAMLVWAGERRLIASIAGAALIGLAASQLWEPCVGEHFGRLVTGLPNERLSQLVPFALYFVAVNTPIVLVTAGVAALSDERRRVLEKVVAPFGAAVVVVIGGLALVGQTDQLIARLVAWSI